MISPQCSFFDIKTPKSIQTHISQSGHTLDGGNKLKVMANVTFPFRKSFYDNVDECYIFLHSCVEFLASFV